MRKDTRLYSALTFSEPFCLRVVHLMVDLDELIVMVSVRVRDFPATETVIRRRKNFKLKLN